MFYRGKSGNFTKVDSYETYGVDQVLVTSGDFQFFTNEDYFKDNVLKKLPKNEQRQAALDEFVESLPE